MPKQNNNEVLLLGVCTVFALVLWRSCSSGRREVAPTAVGRIDDKGIDETPQSLSSEALPNSPAPSLKMPTPKTEFTEGRSIKEHSGISSSATKGSSMDSSKTTRNASIPELPSAPPRESVALEKLQVPHVAGSSVGNSKNAVYPTKPPEKPSDIVIWKEPPQKNTSAGASQSLRIPEPPARR